MKRGANRYVRPKGGLFVVCRVCVFALLLLFLGACGGGVYHVVQPGQNLYRISRTYGISEPTIAKANRITDPTKVRVGTRLFIPGADRVRYVPAAPVAKPVTPHVSTTPSKTSPVQQKTNQPELKPAPKPIAKKIPQTSSKPVVSQQTVKSTEIKTLEWPLRGKIVRSFSAASRAGSGKGIEIGVRAGSSIKAAEAGKVIYSGDGVKGYGHLIILQHENDLFTVYGFNQRNFVRQGDFVSKGERIALSGVPPSGGAARLHFEVRKGKQAVNPILYLP